MIERLSDILERIIKEEPMDRKYWMYFLEQIEEIEHELTDIKGVHGGMKADIFEDNEEAVETRVTILKRCFERLEEYATVGKHMALDYLIEKEKRK